MAKVEKQGNILKFIILSLIGAFLFLIPIPHDGGFNIPLGIAISWLGDTLRLEDFDINALLAAIFIIASVLGTLVAWVFKPAFIMKNERLKEAFLSKPIYFITKLVALFVILIVYFDLGEGVAPVAGQHFLVYGFNWFVQATYSMGGIMFGDLLLGLVPIFIILAFAVPLLTDFGIMEFVGVLIRKFIRKLFTLPGRASIDMVASWFGSSAVAILITRDQQEKGYYSGREAANIAVNFAVVSLPFSLVVAGFIDLMDYFIWWYLVVLITCIVLGVIMPRIWPLKSLKDTYLTPKPAISEEVNTGSKFKEAVKLASGRASGTTAKDVGRSGIQFYINVFMDLFPIILAWGTLAMIVEAFTPFFAWISLPMEWLLNVFNIADAASYAHITLVGFVDMFLPAILLGPDSAFDMRFILGALSIVQVIYLAETGALIIKSKIPLGFGKLLVLFLIRTIIGLPIILFLSNIVFSFIL